MDFIHLFQKILRRLSVKGEFFDNSPRPKEGAHEVHTCTYRGDFPSMILFGKGILFKRKLYLRVDFFYCGRCCITSLTQGITSCRSHTQNPVLTWNIPTFILNNSKSGNRDLTKSSPVTSILTFFIPATATRYTIISDHTISLGLEDRILLTKQVSSGDVGTNLRFGSLYVKLL